MERTTVLVLTCFLGVASGAWMIMAAMAAWAVSDFMMAEERRPPGLADYAMAAMLMWIAASPGAIGLVCSIMYGVRARSDRTRTQPGFEVAVTRRS